MDLFDSIKEKEKNKIFFIHLNHTNPLLNKNSDEYKLVITKGYNVAEEGMKLKKTCEDKLKSIESQIKKIKQDSNKISKEDFK